MFCNNNVVLLVNMVDMVNMVNMVKKVKIDINHQKKIISQTRKKLGMF
jgi:hypothetical protein